MKMISLRWWFNSAPRQVLWGVGLTAILGAVLYAAESEGLIPRFKYPELALAINAMPVIAPVIVSFIGTPKDKKTFHYFRRMPWRNVLLAQIITMAAMIILGSILTEIFDDGSLGSVVRAFYNSAALFSLCVLSVESITLIVQLKIDRRE